MAPCKSVQLVAEIDKVALISFVSLLIAFQNALKLTWRLYYQHVYLWLVGRVSLIFAPNMVQPLIQKFDLGWTHLIHFEDT